MADHGQPDMAGGAATAQAEAERPGVPASVYQSAVARTEAPPVYHGRPISWVAVSIILVGFVLGGAALIFGTNWVLFWAGCGITALGGIIALAGRIFDDWY